MSFNAEFRVPAEHGDLDSFLQKPVDSPYPLAARQHIPQGSAFSLGTGLIGSGDLYIIAGPCSVEDRSQVIEIALAVKEAGAHALRGGAFKPRTSPYSFQGLGERGLELLAEARQVTGLPVVTEVMAVEQIPVVMEYSDMFQIGSRNMHNFPLLQAVGQTSHPVLLKRGYSATLEELLLAAEYILSCRTSLPPEKWCVALCERGIRTYETATRNTTDINAIPALKIMTHLPVLLDPSHSTGDARFVSAVARAGVAAGADGLMIEVHADPDQALSDAQQALRPDQFAILVRQVHAIQRVLREEANPLTNE